MTPARWTFVTIFGLGIVIALGMGITNLVAPGAVDIKLNGEPAVGIAGIWAALLAWGIPTALFGLIAAGIVAIFTRKKKTQA